MIENLPIYISIIFIITTLTTLLLFYSSVKNSSAVIIRQKSTTILFVLVTWLVIQAVFTLKNVYNTNTKAVTPKIFLAGLLPALITIVILFITAKGRLFIDSLPLKNITYVNIVRIPVELVLLWLCLNKAVPQLITFEGRNFDIISGITAPFIAYFGFVKRTLNRNLLLAWNFICLGLLLNVAINAILSAPFPLQKFAFDQPNIAILNFPFSWLPTFIVPIVLFGHLTSIRQLIKIPK